MITPDTTIFSLSIVFAMNFFGCFKALCMPGSVYSPEGEEKEVGRE